MTADQSSVVSAKLMVLSKLACDHQANSVRHLAHVVVTSGIDQICQADLLHAICMHVTVLIWGRD